jgi:hypothetical protein
LVIPLEQAETWGEALASKPAWKERAATIGRFIHRFRLASRERPRGKTLYRTAEAIEKIRASLPFSPRQTAVTAASAAMTVNRDRLNVADGEKKTPFNHKVSAEIVTTETAAAKSRANSARAAHAAEAADTSGLMGDPEPVLKGEL